MKSLQWNSKGGTPVWRSMKWQPLMAFDNLTFFFFLFPLELLGVASKAGELFGSAREGQGQGDMDRVLSSARHSRGQSQPERDFCPLNSIKIHWHSQLSRLDLHEKERKTIYFKLPLEFSGTPEGKTNLRQDQPELRELERILRKVFFSTSVWKKKNVTVDTALYFSSLFFAKIH